MVNEKGKEKFFSTWALLIHKFLSVSVAMLSENHIHDDNGRIFGCVMSDKGKTIILYNNERCSLLFTHPDESPQKRGSEQYINYLWRFSLGSKAIVALLNCPFVSRALGRKEVQQTFLCSLFLLFAVSEICVFSSEQDVKGLIRDLVITNVLRKQILFDWNYGSLMGGDVKDGWEDIRKFSRCFCSLEC